MKNKLKVIVFLFNILFSQDSNISEPKSQYEDYQVSSERYLTNSNGSIMMNVNIWGHVRSPGSHIVYDGIDFASLLSVVGGPMDGAKLKDVRLYREIPDEDGTIVYKIDLSEFIKTGNRSEFIKIKPNDTVIVPYKLSSYLLKQINFVNTIFNLINIYLQLEYIVSNR